MPAEDTSRQGVCPILDRYASMGNIDVIFSNLCIAQDGTTDPSCVTQADITDNGKSIKVNICGANPGCTATINYEITNNGTVPVIYQLEQPYSGADSPVRIEVCESSDCISGNGGKAQGKIIITTDGDIEPGCSYNLSTGLNFQQAAVESG